MTELNLRQTLFTGRNYFLVSTPSLHGALSVRERCLLLILAFASMFIVWDLIKPSQSEKLDLVSWLKDEVDDDDFIVIEDGVSSGHEFGVIALKHPVRVDAIEARLRSENWTIEGESNPEYEIGDALIGFGIVGTKEWFISKERRKGVVRLLVPNIQRHDYDKIDSAWGLQRNVIITFSTWDSFR